MLRVEFHCHTVYSKDSLTRPESLIETCRRKGIDRVIITDHNTIAGAQVARRLDPERVITGEEIMTTRGEILAAFVQEEIPAMLSPQETIARLRQQDAFISVSHPFDALRSGHWAQADLLEILPLVDAIEGFNARCMNPAFNHQAAQFALEHGVAVTVGSDAHAAFELGRASLLLPEFKNARELRQVIRQGQPQQRLSSPLVHMTSRYAVWVKARRATPDTGE
jgi:predicted metal-dependent phosphoesterase TrpH